MKQLHLSNERGQSLVILAIAAVALIAFVSLAIDGGLAYSQRRIAQNAADAGSIAGTYELRRWQRTNDKDLNTASRYQDTETAVLAKIKEAVNSHNPVSGSIDQVVGYFTDDKGNILSSCTIGDCPDSVVKNAWGIKLDVSTTFHPYFAGVLGWDTMTAGANSLAVTRAGARGHNGYWAAFSTTNNNSGSATVHVGGGGGGSTKNDGSFDPGGCDPTVNDCDGIVIRGNIHSNHIVDMGVEQNVELLSGQVTWSTEGGRCKGCGESNPPPEERPAVKLVLPQTDEYIEFAKANGTWINGNKTVNSGETLGSPSQPITYINGDLNVNGGELHGLIVVSGSVTFAKNGGQTNGNFTIVAVGDITVQGGGNFRDGNNTPYTNEAYPLLKNNTARFVTKGDFKSTGSDNYYEGAIIAETGGIHISGSKNFIRGAIIGADLHLTGSSSRLYYDERYFPPQPDYIELLR